MREKLETLSVSVLKEFAKDKNIKNISAMRKSELIDAILAANNEEEQTHSKHDEEKTVKKEVKEARHMKEMHMPQILSMMKKYHMTTGSRRIDSRKVLIQQIYRKMYLR